MSYGLRLPLDAECDDDDEMPVEPPSPMYTRVPRFEQSNLRTPPRKAINIECPVHTLFSLERPDLQGANVQMLSWEGARWDQDIILKISDGINWVEAKLNVKYRAYLVGKMFKNMDIFQVIGATGDIASKSLFLVRTINIIRLYTENQLPGYPGSGLNVSLWVVGGSRTNYIVT